MIISFGLVACSAHWVMGRLVKRSHVDSYILQLSRRKLDMTLELAEHQEALGCFTCLGQLGSSCSAKACTCSCLMKV